MLIFLFLFQHYNNSRHTVPLAFTVSVMTFWKTFFYLFGFSEYGGGAEFRVDNSSLEEFFLVLIPNGVWIVLPFFVMVALWSRLIPGQQSPLLFDWSRQGCAMHSGSGSDPAMAKGHVRDHVFHAKHA